MRRLLKDERLVVLHNNDLTTHQILSNAARGLGIPRICHHRFCYEQRFTQWPSKYGAGNHLFVSRALMDQVCSQAGLFNQKSGGRLRWAADAASGVQAPCLLCL